MKNKCNQCGFHAPTQHRCLLSGLPVKADKDFCSKFVKDIPKCELCHNAILPEAAIISVKDETVRTLCPECASSLNTCRFCSHAKECLFETDPSPLPKYIQKQIRQGNLTQITTVKNPERIELLCKKGCPCFDPEIECSRQFNTCGKCDPV